MKILTAVEVKKALPMLDCIHATEQAYRSLADGNADVPLRTRLLIPNQDAVTLFMPAFVHGDSSNALAIKIVSLFPGNPAKGMAYIQAAVIVLDPASGKPLAMLEGSSLTAIRTGAASGTATDLLSNPDSSTVAVFGLGAQGATQLEAVCAVRDIQTAWLYDIDHQKIDRFLSTLNQFPNFPQKIMIANSPTQAVQNSDLICCATTSTTPVFSDSDVRPGTHINAIGSYKPEMQEVPSESVARSLIVLDSIPAVLAESGDLIIPINSGLLKKEYIHAEIGEILSGKKPGRTSPSQITFFKSVGLAVQDALAAQLAVSNADRLGIGTEITLS